MLSSKHKQVNKKPALLLGYKILGVKGTADRTTCHHLHMNLPEQVQESVGSVVGSAVVISSGTVSGAEGTSPGG